MLPDLDWICRTDVDDGSNPAWAGVIKAFRFCVIESSIVDLERRRKSGQEKKSQCELVVGSHLHTANIPLSSLSSKQNRGVSAGAAVDEVCGILPRISSPTSRFDLIQNKSSLY